MLENVETGQLTPPANEDDHVRGSLHAPAILVEYGDYQCPYCGMAEQAVQQVLNRMGDRVAFVFRNFPLPQHQYAEIAAEAAEAAAAQGKFWEMHDALYQHQDALDFPHLVRYAENLGLDVQRFSHDVENHSYHSRIERDVQSGIDSGVQGTPTFFINGAIYEGAPEAGAMIRALEQAADGR